MAEKRLFPKILEKIFKDFGGLTESHRSETRVNETMIYLRGTAVHSRQTTFNTKTQSTNIKPLGNLVESADGRKMEECGKNLDKLFWNFGGFGQILLFAPLCKVLHSRAFRSLGEPHYNSGKITNTLRFVFICASCLRHSNNWGLGNYSRNFTVGELRAKSITRNLLNSNSSRWIKDDDSWCIRALIGGTLQFWVEKN